MSGENDDTNGSLISRRDVLRTAVQSGALVSLSGIGVASVERTIDVPVVKLGDEVIKTRTVPRAWWEHVLASRRVTNSIASQFLPKQEVKQVGTRLDSKKLAGRRKMRVAVHVPDTTVNINLPDEVEGVRVEKVEAKQMAPTCDGNQSFDPVPGGVQFNDTNSTSASDLGGSTGCKVTVNDSPRMLTAHHIWDDCSANGESAYQWGDKTGTVDGTYSNATLDYATVTENNNSGIEYGEKIRTDSFDYEVRSHVTNYETLMDDGDTIYKTGRNTDTTTGQIDEVNFSRSYGCTDIDNEGILVTNKQRNGDSGSVTWVVTQWPDGYFASIVSLATFGYGTNCTANGSIGDECSTCNNTDEKVNEYTKSGGTSSEAIRNDTGGDLVFG